MKKLWCLGATLLLPALAWAEPMYVQVDKTRLLAKPSAFAKARATLAYRTQVDVRGKQGAYYLVQTAQGAGFVAAASLNPKKPKYAARLSGDYVSSEEVAMATKGFNAQVETDYRQKNPSLPYGDLDRWEKATTVAEPVKRYEDFRRVGKLGEFQTGGER